AFPTTMSTADGRALSYEVNSGAPAMLLGAAVDDIERLYEVRFEAGRQVRANDAEVVLTTDLADELSLRTGDDVAITTPAGNETVRVVGILADTGAARFNQGNVAFTSLEWARSTMPDTGALTQLFIALDDGVEAEEWIETHGRRLGSGVNVQTFGDYSVADFARRQLQAAGSILNALGATLMFVAGFLIYLTLSTAVVERVRIYGTLRALGARRSQIRRVVVGEALLLGGVATIVGLALGLGVAGALITVTRRFLVLERTGFVIPFWTIVASSALGMVTTVASAFLPALRASKLDPVEAIRGDYEPHVRLSRMWIPGIASLVVGGTVLVRGRSVGSIGGAAPLLLFGSVALTPLLLRPIARLTGRITSGFARGVGDVAVLHLSKERTRSGYTLALVMVVMATVIALSATSRSFKTSMDKQISHEFAADLSLQSPSTLPPGFEEKVAAIDGVDYVGPVAFGWTKLAKPGRDEESALVRFFDPDERAIASRVLWSDGDPDRATDALRRGGALIMGVATAERLDLGAGDRVPLRTSEGLRPFLIAATAEISNSVPTIYISLADGARYFGVLRPSVLTVTAEDGADIAAIREEIESGVGSEVTLLTSTLADVRADIHAQIDSGLNAFLVMLILAGLLGMFGLANTMAVSMMQRYREIGLLRAIGARRGQVRAMALVESSTLVAVAFILALPLGLFLSFPLVNLGAHLVGDLTIHYVFPWRVLPVLAVAGAIAAAITAIGPARRATRLDIETALRFE
ncbi:MAG: FtsX-like permease family protein, partial [Actinomycetota bacterium]